MALVIEDGTNVANADSYITIAEYNTWADARFTAGRTTAPATDAAAEALIYRAMDYFEAQSFQGYIANDGQALQWPRTWVTIDSFAVGANEIPKEVKNSIYELAYGEEKSYGSLDAIERKIKKEKIDVIETEYADNSSSSTLNIAVPNDMKKLLAGGGSGFMVSRG